MAMPEGPAPMIMALDFADTPSFYRNTRTLDSQFEFCMQTSSRLEFKAQKRGVGRLVTSRQSNSVNLVMDYGVERTHTAMLRHRRTIRVVAYFQFRPSGVILSTASCAGPQAPISGTRPAACHFRD